MNETCANFPAQNGLQRCARYSDGKFEFQKL